MHIPAAARVTTAPGVLGVPAQQTQPVRIPGQRMPAAQGTPSSLVKIAENARNRCVACGSTRLTEIAMTLTDGTPVQFTSCRQCEHRAWIGAGEVLPVDAVLSKATKRKDR